MRSTILPDAPCPACGAHTDAASPIAGSSRSVPKPGDLTICFRCGALMSYGLDLRPTLLPAEKIAQLGQETRDQVAKVRRLLDLVRVPRATA